MDSNRRSLLKAGVFPMFAQLPPPENRHTSVPPTQGDAQAYKWVFFQPEELATLDALTETIIPADDHSPGAKAARVSEYLDVMIADAPDADKRLWRSGLNTVNQIANKNFDANFDRCAEDQQIAIVTELAGPNETNPFFVALKRMTIDGYYTSKIGIHQDLQYQGNQAMAEFPGCSQEHAH